MNFFNRNSKPNKEPLGFEVKLSSGDIDSLDDSALDLSAAVEMLGLENEDQKRHPLANHGTYLAYLALRHLRIRDLQRTVRLTCRISSCFFFYEKALFSNFQQDR